VGFKEIADKVWLVSFIQYDLGFFDHETGRVECAQNPFEPKVLVTRVSGIIRYLCDRNGPR
jgi:hypothetical protein